MRRVFVFRITMTRIAYFLWAGSLATIASAQSDKLVPGFRYEPASPVQLDRADGSVLKALDQAKAYLGDKQWSEAIKVILGVTETSGGKLVAVTENRFLPARAYFQLLTTSMPQEGLAPYRQRVDADAKRQYEDAVAARDPTRLLDLVDRALASSWASSALDALGEMSLESGDYAAARFYWQRMIPHPEALGVRGAWPGVPDLLKFDLAAVRARLVLVSILEGSIERARDELNQFSRLHGDARGWFGGRQTNYRKALAEQMAQSNRRPARSETGDWPTVAGSPARNKVAPTSIDVASVAWRIRVDLVGDEAKVSVPPAGAIGSTEEGSEEFCCFPAVAAGKVFVNRQNRAIAVLDLATGRPAWGHSSAVIFHDDRSTESGAPLSPPGPVVGTARYSLTVFGDRLYARMGSPVTSRAVESSKAIEDGYLVCLDLAAEGRLLWKATPENGWAFEGSPVADQSNVYVAMRRNEVQSQAYVACFDAESGELRWRQYVCGADTPARGQISEITHNLLTLQKQTIYFCTNLGAVAALDCHDGQVRWLTLYPRSLQGDGNKPAPWGARDATPCLYDRGTLMVAPADSRFLFCLDAATGQILWQKGSFAEDIVHLLGVADDTLIASGSRLYWIDLKAPEQGRLKHSWPDGEERLGYGRGVIAGDYVYWPTREKIYQFDKTSGRMCKLLELTPHAVGGGNLIVAGGRMLVATSKELVALAPSTRPAGNREEKTIADTRRNFIP